MKLIVARLFFWIFPRWYAPKTICAWCLPRVNVIHPAGWLSDGKISHGICPSCKARCIGLTDGAV